MRRFNFDTYEVGDHNRTAYDACRSIADLSFREAQPLVLTGDPASGKTHLLYAIVNRARSGPARTGIALITSDDFPEEVQRLIVRPGPVEHTRNAILLVDDIDQFGLRARRVAELVDVFLRNGHYVVISSSTPLNAIEGLPEDLAHMIRGGTEIVIESDPAAEDQSRIDTPVLAGAPDFESVPAGPENKPETESQTEEIERLTAENALLKAAANELDPLRSRVAELEDRLEALQLHGESETPRSNRRTNVLEKAATLLDEVEKSRAEIAQLREPAPPQNRSVPFEAPGETGNTDLDTAAVREVESLRKERHRLREQIEALAEEVETLRGAVARANRERDETRRQLRSAFQKLQRYESNIASMKERLEKQERTEPTFAGHTAELDVHSRKQAAEIAEGLREVQLRMQGGLQTVDELTARLDAMFSEAETGYGVRPPETGAPQPAAEQQEVPTAATDEPPAMPEHSDPPADADRGRRIHPFPLPPSRDHDAWEPGTGSVHHVEELDSGGFFGFPESDTDAAI